MDNERFDNIEYDENWQFTEKDTSVPYSETINTDDTYKENNTHKKNRPSGTQTIIRFQLILCLLLTIAFFTIKTVNLDLHNFIMQWYSAHINTTLIITEICNIFL